MSDQPELPTINLTALPVPVKTIIGTIAAAAPGSKVFNIWKHEAVAFLLPRGSVLLLGNFPRIRVLRIIRADAEEMLKVTVAIANLANSIFR